jgi:Fe-S-cluster containining protein
MTITTVVAMSDRLPLTCTRSGTCCHGKMVWLNPWELSCLAQAKEIDARLFRDQFCEFGGIRLRFDGPPGWKGLPACSQFIPGSGCSVHPGRPLACRLYPLGRQLHGTDVNYIHDGKTFPCLTGCAEVVNLPHMTVAEYLAGQAVGPGQAAQDAYLELMQHLADGAFVLLLESGLAASGDQKTLRGWRQLSKAHPKDRAARIPAEWMDRLTLPGLEHLRDDPTAFAAAHHQQLQTAAQTAFANLTTKDGLREAACLMMALSLHLAHGLGSDVEHLADRWISTAKKHGARE